MNKPSHEAAMGRGVHYSRNNKGVKHMKMKRLVAVFLCILLILSNTPITAAEQPNDYNNHWAKETIEKWIEKIQITGYTDKIFSPNKAISRIEFIVFVNRVFGFTDTDEISFKDINVTDWYYDEVRIAIKAGYIRGYDDGTMRPNHSISRQEAAVILARLVKIDALELQESKMNYADSVSIGSWCDKEVKAVTTKGYMKGYPDGRFGPLDQITRAEAITVLDRAEKDSRQYIIIEKPGIYAFGQYRGEIKITSDGVILKDTKVEGQVSITSAAALENILLQNVNINGLLAVRSPDTRIIVENCRISELLVETASGCTWILAEKNTEILKSTLKGCAKLEETDATGKGFEEVLIAGTTKENEITLIGSFLSVRVAAPNTKLWLVKGKIESLNVSLEGKGSVIDIPAGTEVGNLLLQAGVDIKGFGHLKIVMILENGVRIEQRPVSVQFGPGITAVIGYGIRASAEYQ
ncbi:MAG: S-layer domain protein [Clostridia bacterium]|nr:S-layer domain protein [Clostridia bacterium]